MILETLDGLV